MTTFELRIWFGPNDYDIPAGFTRAAGDNLNTFRVGRLQIAYGIEKDD